MNKLAFLILNVLKQSGAVDAMSSMSTNDVCYEIRESGYSYSAINKKLIWLITVGHVMRGIKDGNSNTYYITDTGKKMAQSVNQEEVR